MYLVVTVFLKDYNNGVRTLANLFFDFLAENNEIMYNL